MAILAGVTPSESVKWDTPLSLAKIWPIISHNLETVQIWGKLGLVLITNSKSYNSFRLVPKSVTFNDLERRNANPTNPSTRYRCE